MQTQWTLEVRADFADREKNDAITEAMRKCGLHMHATVLLISDGQSPQVVVYSDDFFTGHKAIDLLYREKGDPLGVAQAEAESTGVDEMSDEMLSALRDMQR